MGVDPRTNQPPAGEAIDDGSSSPVVAPDGSVLFGAYTRFNYARGHLFKFSPNGDFLAAYDFGWDITPAVYPHDGTYSIVLKDNHYDIGSYCDSEQFCPTATAGPYYITQLSAGLKPEWSFQSTNTLSCAKQPDGSLMCTSDHPNGFEWCINAPAVDREGKVYANSEDGHLYVMRQGGELDSVLFLNLAIGAAYTPLSIGPDGTIYTQNDGRLFVVGNGPRRPPGHR
jgi:outer membrane protein assembly factor BamB